MASPNIPSHPLTLPPEIWRLIIHSFSSSPQDLIFLWADCRYISHHFKHEIEQLFITTHLKLIPIDFHMASQYQDITPSGAKRVGCRDHDVLTVFHGLSKDRLDAIYKAETEHGARFLSRLASTDRDVSPSVHTQSPLGNFMNTEFKFDAAGDMHVKWTALLNLLTAEAKSFGQLSPARMHRSSGSVLNEPVMATMLEMQCFGYGTRHGNLFRASINVYGWSWSLEE